MQLSTTGHLEAASGRAKKEFQCQPSVVFSSLNPQQDSYQNLKLLNSAVASLTCILNKTATEDSYIIVDTFLVYFFH